MTQVAIQLPDELSQFVNKSVQAGDFHNADEFFISIVSMYKDRVETRLSEADEAKLVALRADIQIAVDQADRGEIIRDFQMEDFLAERHREHAALKSA
jgi:Arc/MetJ-type ribon-helix-helix transcriptional regulator